MVVESVHHSGTNIGLNNEVILQQELSPVEYALNIKKNLATPLDSEHALARVFNSIEDILFGSREIVTERWKERISPSFAIDCEEWSKHIDQSEAKGKEAAEVLADRERFEIKLRIRQFSELDRLRKTKPEAWYKLVRASMERQYAEIAVFSGIVNNLQAESFRNFGMTKEELLFACEIADKTGPLVNETFMKQMELADRPGGSDPSPNVNENGASYIYEKLQAEGSYKRIPYLIMFSETWPKLVENLHELSTKANELKLTDLAIFLDKIASVWENDTTDFEELSNQWDELLQANYDYALSGCSISIDISNYAYVTGAANKVDADFRVGLQTPELRNLAESYVLEQNVAFQLAQKYDVFSESPSQPTVNHMSYAFSHPAANVFWGTQAETSDHLAAYYKDVTDNVFNYMIFPHYVRVFGRTLSDEDKQQLLEIERLKLVTHENTHPIATPTDPNIKSRTGVGEEINIIEELKADTLDFKVLRKRREVQEYPFPAKKILEVLVIYCLDYINNRDSGDGFGTGMYARSGRIILANLLKSGVLARRGAHCDIIDAEKGFDLFIGIGGEVLKLYTNNDVEPDVNQEIIKDRVKTMLDKSKTAELEELIDISLRGP